ncbi:MAG: hypothetical protein JWN61_164 [Pseudonocardiales bacterium]|nr:hypothetical protein [Pseudonocardiales bacterium]
MDPALLAVLGAAVFTGGATVMQSVAVRRVPTARGLASSALAQLLRSPLYLAALALVALGFAVTALALQTLPVFVVQTARASGLAVTAVLSVWLLGHRLTRLECGALLGVIAGLVLLALSAPKGETVEAEFAIRLGLLSAAAVLVLLAALALRLPVSARSGVWLAIVSGLCFSVPPLAARGISDWTPLGLIGDPASWALGVSALLGLALSAMTLQRTTVVVGTCVMVATETAVSAALGMMLFGDRPQSGRWGLAAGGVVVTLAASLMLARFGAPEEQELVERGGTATPSDPPPARTATERPQRN